MKESKFWQREWHNIRFRDLDVDTSMFRAADAKFYEVFYQEFFRRHLSYSDLDAHHRSIKSATASEILSYIRADEKVLSFGFGTGYVESEMLSKRQDFSLECFERSKTMSSWFVEAHGSIPLHFQFESLKCYDLIYLVQITYAMSKDDIIYTCSKLREKLSPGGRLLLIDTSVQADENNDLNNDGRLRGLSKKFKGWFRPLYYFLFKRRGQQLWGWQRDNACLVSYLKDAGFSPSSIEAKDNQSYKVFKKSSDFRGEVKKS